MGIFISWLMVDYSEWFPIRPDGLPGRTGGDPQTARELPIDVELQGPTVASL